MREMRNLRILFVFCLGIFLGIPRISLGGPAPEGHLLKVEKIHFLEKPFRSIPFINPSPQFLKTDKTELDLEALKASFQPGEATVFQRQFIAKYEGVDKEKTTDNHKNAYFFLPKNSAINGKYWICACLKGLGRSCFAVPASEHFKGKARLQDPSNQKDFADLEYQISRARVEKITGDAYDLEKDNLLFQARTLKLTEFDRSLKVEDLKDFKLSFSITSTQVGRLLATLGDQEPDGNGSNAHLELSLDTEANSFINLDLFFLIQTPVFKIIFKGSSEDSNAEVGVQETDDKWNVLAKFDINLTSQKLVKTKMPLEGLRVRSEGADIWNNSPLSANGGWAIRDYPAMLDFSIYKIVEPN